MSQDVDQSTPPAAGTTSDGEASATLRSFCSTESGCWSGSTMSRRFRACSSSSPVLKEDDSASPVWQLRVGGGRRVRGPWRDGVLLPPSSPWARRPFANGRHTLCHCKSNGSEHEERPHSLWSVCCHFYTDVGVGRFSGRQRTERYPGSLQHFPDASAW